jgi:hypothetical protein
LPRALGRLAPAVYVAQPGDIVDRLARGDFEIVEIDRPGDEIEGAAVHRGTQVLHCHRPRQ